MTTFTEDIANPFLSCSTCGREEEAENLYKQGNALLCEECIDAGAGYMAEVLFCALSDMPPLYATEKTTLDQKTTTLRFKVLGSSWEWYPVEFDAGTGTCFGFVKGDFNEWGYFSLHELISLPFLFWEPLDHVNVLNEALGEE